jgi:hypothetical protein
MQVTIPNVRLTLILAGVLVGRGWMLIVGPAFSIAFFLSRPHLILPGPEFFAYLALSGAFHVGVGLLLRRAGRAAWRMMAAAWMRFIWPKLSIAVRTFLTILRAPIRARIIVDLAWPVLFFGVFFFWHPPRRAAGPIPTFWLQAVTYALGAVVAAWAGYRLTNRGAGGIGRAALGALTVVLVASTVEQLLFLPLNALLYLLAPDPDEPSHVPQLLKQLVNDSAVSTACGAIGGWVGRPRLG